MSIGPNLTEIWQFENAKMAKIRKNEDFLGFLGKTGKRMNAEMGHSDIVVGHIETRYHDLSATLFERKRLSYGHFPKFSRNPVSQKRLEIRIL